MSVESDRPPAADERLAMLAALVSGDVSLAHRLAIELLAQGVPFEEIVNDVLSPVQSRVGAPLGGRRSRDCRRACRERGDREPAGEARRDRREPSGSGGGGRERGAR